MGERLATIAVNRYPDPAAPALKRALREAMRIPDSLEILLGNGSDEILQIVSLALAKPGATVLAPEPSFVMYRLAAIAAGLRYPRGALHADLTLDEKAFLPAIRRPRPALPRVAHPP